MDVDDSIPTPQPPVMTRFEGKTDKNKELEEQHQEPKQSVSPAKQEPISDEPDIAIKQSATNNDLPYQCEHCLSLGYVQLFKTSKGLNIHTKLSKRHK
jgi:hypothetical protein